MNVAPTHTPGPWRVRTEIGTFGDVVDANDDAVAMAQVRNEDAGNFINGDGQPTRQANAHLIAAAPEMLAALKSLHNEARAVLELAREELRPVIGNTNVRCLINRIIEAEDAIAKAEGKP